MYFKSQVLNLGLENQLGQMGEVQKDYNEMDLLELRAALHQCAPSDTSRKLLLRSEFQKRLSLPFACLAVTWFAAPLGLLFRRRGFIAFTFGILMIFAYYLIFIICEVSSLKGLLLPEAGLWVANIVFLALGWLLYRLAVHERQAFAFLKKKKPGETS
jgi:lipopolysaccharide export LptBFGC system permease protein LptF